MQSYLENRPLVTSTPPSTPTHNHCTISAYGFSANPTSTRSPYVPQWRSVARWQTNGADPLPSVRYTKNDQDSGRAAYDLCRKLGCLDVNAVRSMKLSFLRPDEPGYVYLDTSG